MPPKSKKSKQSCAIPGCQSLTKTYRFPQDEEKRLIWLRNMELPHSTAKTAVLCANHFDETAFTRNQNGKRRRPNKDPTIKEPYIMPSVVEVRREIPRWKIQMKNYLTNSSGPILEHIIESNMRLERCAIIIREEFLVIHSKKYRNLQKLKDDLGEFSEGLLFARADYFEEIRQVCRYVFESTGRRNEDTLAEIIEILRGVFSLTDCVIRTAFSKVVIDFSSDIAEKRVSQKLYPFKNDVSFKRLKEGELEEQLNEKRWGKITDMDSDDESSDDGSTDDKSTDRESDGGDTSIAVTNALVIQAEVVNHPADGEKNSAASGRSDVADRSNVTASDPITPKKVDVANRSNVSASKSTTPRKPEMGNRSDVAENISTIPRTPDNAIQSDVTASDPMTPKKVDVANRFNVSASKSTTPRKPDVGNRSDDAANISTTPKKTDVANRSDVAANKSMTPKKVDVANRSNVSVSKSTTPRKPDVRNRSDVAANKSTTTEQSGETVSAREGDDDNTDDERTDNEYDGQDGYDDIDYYGNDNEFDCPIARFLAGDFCSSSSYRSCDQQVLAPRQFTQTFTWCLTVKRGCELTLDQLMAKIKTLWFSYKLYPLDDEYGLKSVLAQFDFKIRKVTIQDRLEGFTGMVEVQHYDADRSLEFIIDDLRRNALIDEVVEATANAETRSATV